MFELLPDIESVKKLYKKLSFHLHPDHGGEHELMVLLNNAYERNLKRFVKETPTFQRKKYEPQNKYRPVEMTVAYDESDPMFHIFDEIFRYANSNPNFDPSFTDSIFEKCINDGFISANQYNSLVNIYYSFQMGKRNE